VLLISVDFLSSEFIRGKEIPIILERRRREGLVVFPILIKHCPWQIVDWLKKIQLCNRLPDGAGTLKRLGTIPHCLGNQQMPPSVCSNFGNVR
jgi:hypothetical protein